MLRSAPIVYGISPSTARVAPVSAAIGEHGTGEPVWMNMPPPPTSRLYGVKDGLLAGIPVFGFVCPLGFQLPWQIPPSVPPLAKGGYARYCGQLAADGVHRSSTLVKLCLSRAYIYYIMVRRNEALHHTRFDAARERSRSRLFSAYLKQGVLGQ